LNVVTDHLIPEQATSGNLLENQSKNRTTVLPR